MSHRVTVYIVREDPEEEGESEIEVEVEFTPGHPGRVSGPPEDCYPPEGGEVEILSARSTRTKETTELTDSEFEEVLKKCEDQAGSEGDYYDDGFDLDDGDDREPDHWDW